MQTDLFFNIYIGYRGQGPVFNNACKNVNIYNLRVGTTVYGVNRKTGTFCGHFSAFAALLPFQIALS